MTDEPEDNPFKAMEPISDTKVAPGVGVAAIALSMAIKYHDISTVQDGELYQAYKMEGRNLTPLHIDMVFETAIKMEKHLLAGSSRIAGLIVDALEAGVAEHEETEPPKPEGET